MFSKVAMSLFEKLIKKKEKESHVNSGNVNEKEWKSI